MGFGFCTHAQMPVTCWRCLIAVHMYGCRHCSGVPNHGFHPWRIRWNTVSHPRIVYRPGRLESCHVAPFVLVANTMRGRRGVRDPVAHPSEEAVESDDVPDVNELVLANGPGVQHRARVVVENKAESVPLKKELAVVEGDGADGLQIRRVADAPSRVM